MPATTKRPKGYMLDWTPAEKTVALLDQVQQVLRDYAEYLPLTARQIFYRLVGQFDYEKTEQAYARLCEALVKARRAQLVGFDAIRDDGTYESGGAGYSGVEEWWRGQLYQARAYERDRMEGQAVRIEVWCEAGGMAPQLAKVVAPYGIGMYSTGGFGSVTVTHEIAMRVIAAPVPTVFMHVGDYDPSGESIFESMTEDVGAFVYGEGFDDWFRPERVALTAGQVNRYDLPTAPPKRTDSRSARWAGETCQAEAMDPETLTGILITRIEGELDLDARDEILTAERKEREALITEVKRNAGER